LTDPSAAPVALDGSAKFTLLPDRVLVERGGRVRETPLDDPGEPAFLRLPSVDLDDGRSLRRAAFDVWAAHVRAAAAHGREFETAFRPPRPLVTALAIGGAGFVCALCATLLGSWTLRPTPAVRVEPTTAESFAIVFSVAVVLGVIAASLGALVRAWRCRRGSYAHVSSRGLRPRQGAVAQPFDAVAAADWHPWVRCTRVEFMDGRADAWIPAESGPLRRLDLLLAALDDRLGASLRAKL
jgi:hypothetical protein